MEHHATILRKRDFAHVPHARKATHIWKHCRSSRWLIDSLLGLAIAPWSVLALGRLRTDAEEERRRKTGEKGRMIMSTSWERTDDEKKMSVALEKVAKEVGTERISAIAIAYLMQKTPVFPIIGGRKVELMAYIEALKIALSEDQIKYLEGIVPLDLGFPSEIIVSALLAQYDLSPISTYFWKGDGKTKNILGDVSGQEDRVQLPTAITPSNR